MLHANNYNTRYMLEIISKYVKVYKIYYESLKILIRC